MLLHHFEPSALTRQDMNSILLAHCAIVDSETSVVSVLPAFSLAIVYALLASRSQLRVPQATHRWIGERTLVRRVLACGRWLRPFMTLEEAEALLAVDGGYASGSAVDAFRANGDDFNSPIIEESTPLLKAGIVNRQCVIGSRPPLHFTLSYTLLPLLQTLIWLAIATHRLAFACCTPQSPCLPTAPALLAITHFTALLIYLSSESPKRPTPPYRLLVLYTLLFVGAAGTLGGDVYRWKVERMDLSGVKTAMQFVNLSVLGWLIAMGITRPMAIPSPNINREKIVCHHSFSHYRRI